MEPSPKLIEVCNSSDTCRQLLEEWHNYDEAMQRAFNDMITWPHDRIVEFRKNVQAYLAEMEAEEAEAV